MVRPLRWVHSLVTERIATIGRITAIGNPIAAEKASWVSSSFGANRIVAVVASTAAMPMLAISQKPDRVSNILRSSTPTSRVIGIGSAWARRGATVFAVRLEGCGAHAATPSRWVSAVSSRNISSRPAVVGRLELGQGDAGRECDLADLGGFRVGTDRLRRMWTCW